jgi:chromosome segregation ATPase
LITGEPFLSFLLVVVIVIFSMLFFWPSPQFSEAKLLRLKGELQKQIDETRDHIANQVNIGKQIETLKAKKNELGVSVEPIKTEYRKRKDELTKALDSRDFLSREFPDVEANFKSLLDERISRYKVTEREANALELKRKEEEIEKISQTLAALKAQTDKIISEADAYAKAMREFTNDRS